MLIKPFKNDLWFRIPKPHNPDRDFLLFSHNQAEFSERTEEAFDKHINRIRHLVSLPYYQKLNGKRIKFIRNNEGLWY